ncbi:MAG: tRNA (guanosine(46)-N7)-methyltransferase TrmB [Hyphomicrobiaceae bacterium]|nr:tRNA (guanosine(46)-N7)-methyltransferase TrmB [Hyphomicrobiaceae bacterium]
MTGSGETPDLRSYGRRRGRAASPRQERLLSDVLPRVRIDLASAAGHLIDPTGLFGRAVEAVWLEIGFGGGEHLVWQAREKPGIGLIGCEPFEDGVVKVLSAIEEHGIDTVRLHADDARPLLRVLTAASIDRVFVLFPDPWPKKRHVKRRLVGKPLLDEIARVLKPGGELRLATDIDDYLRTMLIALDGDARFLWSAAGPADWRERPSDWPQTRYEAKAIREGRRGYFLRLERSAAPAR